MSHLKKEGVRWGVTKSQVCPYSGEGKSSAKPDVTLLKFFITFFIVINNLLGFGK